MDMLDQKTDEELVQSLVAESAKAKNEIRCATNDLKKAHGRLDFILVLLNRLLDRQKD